MKKIATIYILIALVSSPFFAYADSSDSNNNSNENHNDSSYVNDNAENKHDDQDNNDHNNDNHADNHEKHEDGDNHEGSHNGGSGTLPAAPFIIVATKIVCTNEVDLPNWGNGGLSISSTTATTYIASHPTCHLESGWDFQWGYSSVVDPGGSFVGASLFTGVLDNEWKTFGSTNASGVATVSISDLKNSSLIWIREVLKTGYLAFSEPAIMPVGQKNEKSAEIYCHTDVLNFDNYDNISNPQLGQTYHCVAWNVLATSTATTTPLVNNPPVITLLGANPFTVATDTAFIDPSATSTDVEDGDLTSHIITTGTVDASTTGSYILTYTVTDSAGASASTTRTVIINATPSISVNPPSNGSGSNGGGSGTGGGTTPSGHRHDVSNFISYDGSSGSSTECSYLKDYLRKDWNNNSVEVMKVQSFLDIFEKETLSVNGTFDAPTFDAVSRFQTKYASDILTPWGHTAPTGFVYILTKKKINEIYCNTSIALTVDQKNEIDVFSSYLKNNPSNGSSLPVDLSNYVGMNTGSNSGATASTSSIASSIKDKANNLMKDVTSNDGVKNLAVSLFGAPKGLGELSSTYLLILLGLILIVAFAPRGSKKASIAILENSSIAASTIEAPTAEDFEEPVAPIFMAPVKDEKKDDETPKGFKGIIG